MTTGYFLFALAARFSLWYDQRRFITAKIGALTANEHNRKLILPAEVSFTECQDGKHEIRKLPDGQYELCTQGVLTDAQHQKLISSQRNDRAKQEVALYGLYQQLNILSTQGTSSTKSSTNIDRKMSQARLSAEGSAS